MYLLNYILRSRVICQIGLSNHTSNLSSSQIKNQHKPQVRGHRGHYSKKTVKNVVIAIQFFQQELHNNHGKRMTKVGDDAGNSKKKDKKEGRPAPPSTKEIQTTHNGPLTFYELLYFLSLRIGRPLVASSFQKTSSWFGSLPFFL